jgi:hypothetical protein
MMNEIYEDENVMYFIPIDYAFLYMLPYDAKLGASGKILESMQGMGKVMMKPQTLPEQLEYIFYTTYSFIFGGATTGAYQKIIYA